MTDLEIKEIDMFNAMIDERIELFGLLNTIYYLLDNDFTKEDLINLRFDEEEIDLALNAEEE